MLLHVSTESLLNFYLESFTWENIGLLIEKTSGNCEVSRLCRPESFGRAGRFVIHAMRPSTGISAVGHRFFPKRTPLITFDTEDGSTAFADSSPLR